MFTTDAHQQTEQAQPKQEIATSPMKTAGLKAASQQTVRKRVTTQAAQTERSFKPNRTRPISTL